MRNSGRLELQAAFFTFAMDFNSLDTGVDDPVFVDSPNRVTFALHWIDPTSLVGCYWRHRFHDDFRSRGRAANV